MVDDHLLCRIGIRQMLLSGDEAIEIVFEASGVDEFLSGYVPGSADVALLDIIMPGRSGVDIVRELKSRGDDIRIMMLSSESSPEVIGEVVALGVDGFVSKSIPAEELRSAVTQVAMGLQYFGADISHIISYVHKAKAESGVAFSERELEIISLCSKGLTVKEIAWNLNLGVGTVNTHKNNIFKKLGINNSVELVLYALRTGIVTL